MVSVKVKVKSTVEEAKKDFKEHPVRTVATGLYGAVITYKLISLFKN